MHHVALAFVAAVLGTLVAGIAGLDGRIVFFVPAVLLASAAGASSARRGDPPASRTIVAMLLASAAWFVVIVTVTVTQSDLYGWPIGFETRFTGTGYCGDFSCAGQILVTLPFVVNLAYVVGTLAAAPPLAGRRPWLLIVVVAYLTAFTGAWLWLSGSTRESLFERHIYPYSSSGQPLPPDLWSFVAASDEYVKEPPAVRRARAAAFYDSVLDDLAADNYFDPAPYRDTFISGSAEGILNTHVDPKTGERRPYRELFGYSSSAQNLPRRDIPRLTRDAARLALLPAAALISGWWLVIGRRQSRD